MRNPLTESTTHGNVAFMQHLAEFNDSPCCRFATRLVNLRMQFERPRHLSGVSHVSEINRLRNHWNTLPGRLVCSSCGLGIPTILVQRFASGGLSIGRARCRVCHAGVASTCDAEFKKCIQTSDSTTRSWIFHSSQEPMEHLPAQHWPQLRHHDLP